MRAESGLQRLERLRAGFVLQELRRGRDAVHLQVRLELARAKATSCLQIHRRVARDALVNTLQQLVLLLRSLAGYLEQFLFVETRQVLRRVTAVLPLARLDHQW